VRGKMKRFSMRKPLRNSGVRDAFEITAEEPEGSTDTGSFQPRFDAPVIGVFSGVSDIGSLLVDFPGNPFGVPIPTVSSVVLHKAQAGRRAVLLFEQADPGKPILVSLLAPDPIDATTGDCTATENDGPSQGSQGTERLVISAEREVVLRCGAASITLTQAGKVIIRGTYVLSRSSGVNKIKGGSVQIN
jgi:hypothetical protein